MDSSRSAPPMRAAPAAKAPESDDEARLFEEDDSDLSESQEFDRALAAGAEAMQAQDPVAARGFLERALRYKPRNQRARNMLGLALFKLGELDKAESLYRGLIEDHPSDPTLRVNLGLVFLKSGASAEAVRCFETALDLAPGHQKAMNYLGLAFAQKGEHGRARECFLRSDNPAMAERMTQALQSAPIHHVAEEAEEAIASEHPFRSALDSIPPPQMDEARGHDGGHTTYSADGGAYGAAEQVGAGATEDAAAASDALAERDPTALPSPSNASRWVATTPASTAMAPSTSPDARPPQAFSRAGFALPTPGETQPDPESAAPGAAHAPSAPTALAHYTERKRLSVPAGEGGFVVGPTEVVIQVRGEMLLRLDGLVASWGAAAVKPELKRFRGKATDKPFGEGARRMLRASGEGRFVVSRAGRTFTALELDDEPAYFREETIFAFEESLLFENGRVPSKSGADLHLVHLRGHGRLLLVTVGTPRSLEVSKSEPLRIPMDQLVGWHGPLIQPRLVPIVEEAPELGVALELAGEGRALVDAPEGR